jgi:hypothetical protein
VYPKFLTETNEKILISTINIPHYDRQIAINLILIDLEKDADYLSERLIQNIINPEVIKGAGHGEVFTTN